MSNFKNYIPLSEVEKVLSHIKDNVSKDIINAIEKPMDSEETAKFLRYKSRKAFQNDAHKYPVHRIGNKLYCFRSELNNFIKSKEED